MLDDKKITIGGGSKQVWPFKTAESLEKGLELIANRATKTPARDAAISRLLLTDKTLVGEVLPTLFEIFKQEPLNIRHIWIDHFETLCLQGVDFTDHLILLSAYLKDKNFHFREAVGSFLIRRGPVIACCYKDINWCLTQKNEDVQKLGLQLTQIVGEPLDETTQKFVVKLATGAGASDEIITLANKMCQGGDKAQETQKKAPAVAAPLADTITCKSLTKKRILLVTNHKIMKVLLLKILKHFEAEVTVANTASDTLRAVRDARDTGKIQEIVIVDMPDPLEILKYLKQERGRDLQKILVLSKALSVVEIKRIAQYKIDGLLLKPFGIQDLTNALIALEENHE